MNVTLYVEGGGDSKELQSRCREGFRKLLINSGFSCCLPQIVACGGRGQAFHDFRVAHNANIEPDRIIMLLVDSEEPVSLPSWEHVMERDRWIRPPTAQDHQLQFMKTCMETWIVTDREAVRRFFPRSLRENALPPLVDLETRSREDIQAALIRATVACPTGGYQKGSRSFQLLALLNPDVLRRHLTAFVEFISVLEALLKR